MAPGNGKTWVQVVDVAGTEACSNLADYPFAPWGGAGVLLENTPILCGSQSIITECYSYDKATNTWNLFSNLATGRRYFDAAVFKGSMWVTGGNYQTNYGTALDSIEIIATDGTLTSGPTLPVAREGHCIVVLNDDEFMILGSQFPDDHRKNTIIYNANSETFSSGPSMNYDRMFGTCSVFQSKFHNDRQVVLVAGGNGDGGTAELLDFTLENAQWVEGMNFTNIFQDFLCVPKEEHYMLNDFLLLFSVDNLPITTQIYNGAASITSMTGDGVYLRSARYLFLFTCDESSCQWTTVKEGLEYSQLGIMMPLPSDYTCE